MESCITDQEDRRVAGLYLRLITCFKLSIQSTTTGFWCLKRHMRMLHLAFTRLSTLFSKYYIDSLLLCRSKALYISQVVYVGHGSN